MNRQALWTTCLAWNLLAAVCVAGPKEDLEKRGVRVSGSTAIYASESDLNERIRDLPSLRRKIRLAGNQFDANQKAKKTLDNQITRLNQQQSALSLQLANVQDAVTNNRLVGAISALDAQLRLAYDSREKLEERDSQLHREISAARDTLLTHSQEMRKIADSVSKRYADVDKETLALIASLNSQSNSQVVLQPSSVFTANLKKLQQLESEIVSGSVPLRRDRNTFWATVKLNGDHSVEMVVDSGASIVQLPWEAAVAAGIKPDKDSPKIRLRVADGRSVDAWRMTIDAMQLGPFTTNNVECVVLDSAAKNAPALLGMSFLGAFRFELNAGQSTLSLSHIGEAPDDARQADESKSLFRLSNNEWKLVRAETGVAYSSDRKAVLKSLPKELDGAMVVVRTADNRAWLNGEIVALKPTWVYAALLRNYKHQTTKGPAQIRNFFNNTGDNLRKAGWTIVDEFDADCVDGEAPNWTLVGKRFESGPITITPPIGIKPQIIFFVGGDEPASR
ncbi:MAG TPA: TIGR02281 family clan AA aspartic protease [Caulifigura sp.]|nr:TIGR02281 family clan AA aspartic protease [Caulifigura sp.]